MFILAKRQGRERPNIKKIACLPCSNISSNSMTNYGPPDMHYTAPAPTASSTYSSQLEDQKGSSLSHSSYNSHYGTLPRPRKHSSQYSEAEKSGIVVSSYATLPRQRRWVGWYRLTLHTTYSWNIKWQKCAGMGLNGFILKRINENENIKMKKKSLWAV